MAIGITIIAVFLISIFANFALDTYLHEQVHYTIYDHYGQEPEVELDAYGLLGGRTRATSNESIPADRFPIFLLANEINEAVSYNKATSDNLMIICTVFLAAILIITRQ